MSTQEQVSSQNLRAHAVAKLKRAASLPRMKDGRPAMNYDAASDTMYTPLEKIEDNFADRLQSNSHSIDTYSQPVADGGAIPEIALWDPDKDFKHFANDASEDQPSTLSTSGDYVEGKFAFRQLFLLLHQNRLEHGTPHAAQDDNLKGIDNPHLQTTLSPANSNRKLEAADWTAFIMPNLEMYIGGGGFGDVYEGQWINLPDSISVDSLPRIVVKRVRFSPSKYGKEAKERKRMIREVAVWHVLDHENIVPFVGVHHDPKFPPALISEWMVNGTVKDYILKTEAVCLYAIITGVVQGLNYLHQYMPTILHGDMKPDNVLINRRGCPCLCDFGLSRMLDDSSLWNTSATSVTGTLRWQAPELLDGSASVVMIESDVYGYAMTCYEIITNHPPFYQYPRDAQVIAAVISRREAVDISAFMTCVPIIIWELLQECWSLEPSRRPNTHTILGTLGSHACEHDESSCFFRDSR